MKLNELQEKWGNIQIQKDIQKRDTNQYLDDKIQLI
jgi:hypothetical protein